MNDPVGNVSHEGRRCVLASDEPAARLIYAQKVRRAALTISVFLLVVPYAPAEASIDKDAYAKAARAFEAVNGRFDKASSLQYQVERKTVAKGVTLVEKWSFACATQGLVRIDYRAPESRVFMADGLVFTEYLPTARKALQTPMTWGGAVAQARIASVLQRLSVDGLRIGDYERLLDHLTVVEVSSNQPSVLIVEGRDPRYSIRIDTQRQLLLSFEKRDQKGRLMLSIQTGDFFEAKPGFWMPTKVKTVFLDQEVLGERETTLSDIMVNTPIPKEKLDFTLPDDVTIMISQDK